MDLFGLGPLELLVVLLVAFLLFGPSKLPEIGNTLGRLVREFRKATREIGEDINQSLGDIEGRRALGKQTPRLEAERTRLISELETERTRLAAERAELEAEKSRLALQKEQKGEAEAQEGGP